MKIFKSKNQMHKSQKDTFKHAFTLAEVMITVAIIGVVAAVVMPTFIRNNAERINSHRQANIAQKVTKSVELMIANGDYQGIYNTEQFVNKLSKYLKIAKVCNSDNLTDCWPTKKIKTATGKEYNIENAQTGKDLNFGGKDNDTPNVGLILADGASLIMTFNPNASAISAEDGFTSSSKDLPVGNKKTQSFAYTSNATDAIDFIMDVNGKTGPNEEYNLITGEYFDIRSFKAATFGECGGIRIPGIGCIVNLNTSKNWSDAKMACSNAGMELPDIKTLITINGIKSKYSGSIPQGGQFWSSTEGNNGYACRIIFVNGTNYDCGISKTSNFNVLCLSK